MIRAAVLGSPISHSLSPRIHQRAYEILGVEGNYSSFEVRAGELSDFLKRNTSYSGFSLTMPLKEEALTLVSSMDEFSRRSRAINTLIRKDDSWHGFNTDVLGFKRLFAGLDMSDVHILGAGATARSALVALGENASHITVHRRSASRDAELQQINPNLSFGSIELEDMTSGTVFINTLPITAFSQDLHMRASGSLIDALYAPWPPPLTFVYLHESRTVRTGVELLVAQAVEQVRYMTEIQFDVDELYRMILAQIAADFSGHPQ